MTPQFKDGRRGIEWTDYTWNPVGGCNHDCKWEMPDGIVAECYAKTIAEHEPVARFYEKGFAHHYWRPHVLEEPRKLKKPALIFIDSMSDLFSAAVPADATRIVLNYCAGAAQHIFQVLTKAPKRLLQFQDHIPPNVWVGISSAPDWFMGKKLTDEQKQRFLTTSLEALHTLKLRGHVVWMSVEPLSWDISRSLAMYHPLDWAVIGAASAGARLFQPDKTHVSNLLYVLDKSKTPVFFKGNLEWHPRREDFPAIQHEALDARQQTAQKNGWPLNKNYRGMFQQGKLL